MTDEVLNQRRYGALPLSYGALVSTTPTGFEPATPGLQCMYSNSAVGHVLAATKCWSEIGSLIEPAPNVICQSRGDENRTHMDSEPAVAECFKRPNEVVPRYRPYRTFQFGSGHAASSARDSVRLTSRSPGIATLGSS